jgi:hypothetical protein
MPVVVGYDLRASDFLSTLTPPIRCVVVGEVSGEAAVSLAVSCRSSRGARHRPRDYRTAQTASHSKGKATMPFARSFVRTNVWKLGLVS